MDIAAPLPPLNDTAVRVSNLSNIAPAMNTVSAVPEKSCEFSRHHRKHTVGYEIDPSRHIAFDVRPSMDIWNPSDMDTEVSLRFTKSLGGPANKRPNCTYGSGFYGLLPFASNEGINLSGALEGENVKSYIQERLDERERRRQEREAKLSL